MNILAIINNNPGLATMGAAILTAVLAGMGFLIKRIFFSSKSDSQKIVQKIKTGDGSKNSQIGIQHNEKTE